MAALNLFNINEQYEVELDKEWIMLVPEFAAVLKADKGSKGDSDGRKKLKARKQLAYIYFMEDPRSPLYEWEIEKKKEEALNFAGITKEDITGVVIEAHQVYKTMLNNASRSLKTYEKVLKSLDKLDEYYEKIDFTAVDKKGELLHDPSKYLMNLTRLKQGYEALDSFRDRVMAELRSSGKIRGTSQLGYYEGKPDLKRAHLREDKAKPPAPPPADELIVAPETTIGLVDRSENANSMESLGAFVKSLLPSKELPQVADEEEEEDIDL